MKIAGLDIGTTGCKCTVFDEQGDFLGTAYREYPVKRAVSGHEIDVSTLMDGVYEALSEMSSQYPDIAGIGVTSFGEAFVMVDEKGNLLHPAMLLTDPRGREEYRELVERLGEERIAEITGARPHEMYSISRIMWIKKNRPEVYQAAKRILLMEDYVVYHLSGNAQIDYSLAAIGAGAFDGTVAVDWCSGVWTIWPKRKKNLQKSRGYPLMNIWKRSIWKCTERIQAVFWCFHILQEQLLRIWIQMPKEPWLD